VKRGPRWNVGVWALAIACTAATAQQSAPLSDADRLRRDAESPMRWIKLHADAPAAPVTAASPAPAGKAGRAKPATRKTTSESPAASAPSSTAAAAPASAAGADRIADATPAPADELSPTRRSDPQWDPGLMQALRRGRVELRFSVGPDGLPASAEVIASSDARLDGAALAAMRQWRFARLSTARTASVEFGFDLDREAAAGASAAPSEPELVAIEQPEPTWDARLMQSLRKASVRLRFEVGRDGRPVRTEVVTASDPRLAAPALEAIRRWRFQPIDRPRTAGVEFGFDLDR